MYDSDSGCYMLINKELIYLLQDIGNDKGVSFWQIYANLNHRQPKILSDYLVDEF